MCSLVELECYYKTNANVNHFWGWPRAIPGTLSSLKTISVSSGGYEGKFPILPVFILLYYFIFLCIFEGVRLAASRQRNNVRLAARCKQIVPEWPPVACENSMRLAASRIQNVLEWPPVACKNSMRLAERLVADALE